MSACLLLLDYCSSLVFLKKEYNVKCRVIVNKPSQKGFDYVKYLKNQDNFSVWVNIDAGMKNLYRGVDGTVRFVSALDNKTKMQE